MTSLSVVSYIERINRMYRLIRKESTGSRAELAGRMRVSERTVSNYLEELRLMGADIRFSKTRNTYYFFNITNRFSSFKYFFTIKQITYISSRFFIYFYIIP